VSNRLINRTNDVIDDAIEFLRDKYWVDVDGYDIIVGYRADDSYFTFARDFLSNAISFQQLSQVMYLGNLGEQIVLKSQKSFDSIRFLGWQPVDSEDYYTRRLQRNSEANVLYKEERKRAKLSDPDQLLMIDIIRNGGLPL
jgi:hypothetical protein